MCLPLHEPETTRAVIGSFYEVYNKLGFGFLESIYVAALELELRDRHHEVGREVQVHVRYKGCAVGMHRLDMLVDSRIIVEVKSCVDLHKSASRQVYNYLRATNLEVGLLLHCGLEPKFFACVNRHLVTA